MRRVMAGCRCTPSSVRGEKIELLPKSPSSNTSTPHDTNRHGIFGDEARTMLMTGFSSQTCLPWPHRLIHFITAFSYMYKLYKPPSYDTLCCQAKPPPLRRSRQCHQLPSRLQLLGRIRLTPSSRLPGFRVLSVWGSGLKGLKFFGFDWHANADRSPS